MVLSRKNLPEKSELLVRSGKGQRDAGKKVSFVGFLAIFGQNDWGQNDCSLAKVQNSGLPRRAPQIIGGNRQLGT